MHTNRDKIEWLHSLIQELEGLDVELPMGDYMEVYEIIETLRDDIPEYQATLTSVQDPQLVDVTGSQPIVLNVMHANMVINISGEGLVMDFFDDGNDDVEPDATLGMTFDEWREYADWKAQA
jgi:hypothetical protein